jgi:hypothetical protein
MPSGLALRGLLGNWVYLSTEIAADAFYAGVTGLDAPAANLVRGLRAFLFIGLFAALAYAADRVLGRTRRPRVAALVAGALVFAGLAYGAGSAWWMRLGRALPFTSLLACAVLVPIAFAARRQPERFARLAPLALLAVYALGLLGKLVLSGRIFHYGFVLAMPATLLVVLALVHSLPRLRRESRSRGAIARGAALGTIAAGVCFHLLWSNTTYRHKNLPIGEGADRLLFEDPDYTPRARQIALALDWLDAKLAPDATLLVYPEGLALNYWLRRASPTRYGLFLPTELRAAGGEAVVLEALRSHPPDWVALLDREHEEFGVGPFGSDPENGLAIARWLEADYRRELAIGPEPFRGDGFGIVVLRRAR